MAANPMASRLTEAHRLAQARLGARTVQAMFAVWPLLDAGDLDGTEVRWIRAAFPIINAQRATSARLAANYLRTFRRIEIPAASDAPAILAEAAPPAQVAASLHVTGPVAVKTHMRIHPVAWRAMEIGRSMSAASAMRHALDGGRQTIIDTVASDERALGWARATSADACSFCAMLAGRGPVYREETVGFEAHDHCSCAAEPIYRRDASWPAGALRYRDLWQESTRGLSGAEARNAFRKALDAA